MDEVVSLVLAAGKGTRITDVTNGRPKQMLPLNGETLVSRILRQLRANGIHDHFLSSHNHTDEMIQYLERFGKSLGNIRFLRSFPSKGENLFGLLDLAENMDPRGAVIAMGDNVFGDADIENFFSTIRSEPDADMVFAVSTKTEGRSGKVFSSSLGFSRNGSHDAVEYCGMAFLSKKILRELLDHRPDYLANSITDILNRLAKNGFSHTLQFVDTWYDINDQEKYNLCMTSLADELNQKYQEEHMTYTYQYPHMAVTVDLVLFDDSTTPHVLLIKRAKDPFEGMWALPGGYVDMEERIETAAKRELEEETSASVDDATFLGFFDEIHRDPRERTVSFAFWATTKRSMQNVKAADDARDARWFSIEELPPMAFDHGKILERAIQAHTS